MGTHTRAAFLLSSALAGLAALAAAGCTRVDAAGVRTVEAKIDGITCQACVPPLTKSLKRHFTHADVAVDDDKDTATLKLAGGQNFSPAEFRQAVADVKMRVMTVHIEACGQAEAAGDQRVLAAGTSRFVLRGAQTVPLHQPLCVKGTLDSTQDPAVLDIGSVRSEERRVGKECRSRWSPYH